MKKITNERKSSKCISDFLSFTRDLHTEYNHHSNAVHECDKATGDLKHLIEFGRYADRNKAATLMNHVLKKRRVHKDYLDINEELYKYFQDTEFIKVYRRLEQLLGTVRKQERYIETERTYKPRVLNLTIKTIEEKDT